MQDADFSDDFCKFIQAAVASALAAELLLAISAQPQTWWTPSQLAMMLGPAMGITEGHAAQCLGTLQSCGLLEADGNRRFRYSPASDELAAHVATLSRAYRERPVTLIRMIYALRDAKVKSFAEAFKLRK